MFKDLEQIKEFGKGVENDLVKYRKMKQALDDHSALLIYNVFSFMYNYPGTFIEQCWSDDAHMRDHLHTMWISLNQERILEVSDIDRMVHFFGKLDSKNRTRLCVYINRWIKAQKS
jgi:hypothetical protein